jgi:hypothetical protein
MDSPLAAGFLRGVGAAIVIGVEEGGRSYFVEGLTLEVAVARGLTPMILALLALLGWGAYDQKRVSDGRVIASDVPIQLAAKTTHKSAETVAADFAPSKLR